MVFAKKVGVAPPLRFGMPKTTDPVATNCALHQHPHGSGDGSMSV